jgi:osmotically-inducible protein OsmY
MNPDKVLKESVEAELDWLPGVDAADIGVAVQSGVVTLTGHVSTYAQKVAVEQAVKRLKGVRGVAEEIEIRPYGNIGQKDDEVAGRVVHLLGWDSSVPRDAIKVEVANGFVTLTGEVDWQYQRLAAERGVRALSGVRGLNNAITVKPHVQPKDIKRRIEAALERQADLDADRIHVTVEGAKVRLEVHVRAWHEREAAERAVWAAPGVQAVEDHVTIGL